MGYSQHIISCKAKLIKLKQYSDKTILGIYNTQLMSKKQEIVQILYKVRDKLLYYYPMFYDIQILGLALFQSWNSFKKMRKYLL